MSEREKEIETKPQLELYLLYMLSPYLQPLPIWTASRQSWMFQNCKLKMSFLGFSRISQPLYDITHGGKHLAMTLALTKCLSATERAMGACLRAVAAATKAALATADIVAMCPLIAHVLHTLHDCCTGKMFY